MTLSIKQILIKYRKIITYLLSSCFTALAEVLIGLLMLNVFSMSVVAANSVGIVIGSVIHYLLVTRTVFRKNTDLKTAAVYIATFFLGMLLQNLVVYFVNKYLTGLVGENISYIISKGASLVVSFVVMYQIRKKLYSLVGRDINE